MSDLSKFDLSEKINTVQEQKRDTEKLSKDLTLYQCVGFATAAGGILFSVPVLPLVGVRVAATALVWKEYAIPLQKEKTVQAQKNVLEGVLPDQGYLDFAIKEFKEYNKSRKKVFKTYVGAGALLSAPLIMNGKLLTDAQAIVGVVCVTIAAAVAAKLVNNHEKKKSRMYDLSEGVINDVYAKSLKDNGLSNKEIFPQIKNKL